MKAPAKLIIFAAALAVLLIGGARAGAALSPEVSDTAEQAHDSSGGSQEHSDRSSASEPAETHGEGDETEGAPQLLRGLAVAENGLRLVVDDPDLRRGRRARLRFRIVDDRGTTVRDFDVEHERRMHLILARRDLTGFQHLHPKQAPDGSWSVPVRLADAGSYRMFADFSHGGEVSTLASDLRVDGRADLRPQPDPSARAVSDGGYDVRLDAGAARPGKETDLRFTITRDGASVDTEPYLGAGGHLVALRDGDLAFLHVHPLSDDAVEFAATFPTSGRYRLFLQFQHEGRIQTVAFTIEVR